MFISKTCTCVPIPFRFGFCFAATTSAKFAFTLATIYSILEVYLCKGHSFRTTAKIITGQRSDIKRWLGRFAFSRSSGSGVTAFAFRTIKRNTHTTTYCKIVLHKPGDVRIKADAERSTVAIINGWGIAISCFAIAAGITYTANTHAIQLIPFFVCPATAKDRAKQIEANSNFFIIKSF